MATPIEWGIGALIGVGGLAATAAGTVIAGSTLAHTLNKDLNEKKSKTTKEQQNAQMQPPHPTRQSLRVESHWNTTNGGRVEHMPNGSIIATGRAAGDSTSGCLVSVTTTDYGYGPPVQQYGVPSTPWSRHSAATYQPSYYANPRYLSNPSVDARSIQASPYMDAPPSYMSSDKKHKVRFWKN